MDSNIITQARKNWTQLGYGMFIHFGVNTFSGSSWGDGTFPAKDFNPDKMDVGQWADVASKAGMKYAILTAKHHDGFCLWPSKYTEYSVKNSACQRDIVAEFVSAFRAAGIKVGLYYSLWDRSFSQYDNDEAYISYMKEQLHELLTNYGDILELWFDGGWDKDNPTRDWPFDPSWIDNPDSGFAKGKRWGWTEIYKLIHELQPKCLVIQNSSSDCPGEVKYPPVDIRTSEHFDFIWQNNICEADNSCTELPLEYCTTLTPDWFWSPSRDAWIHPSSYTIASWLARARKNNANLLLNVGPDMHGLIPEYHCRFLNEAISIYNDGINI